MSPRPDIRLIASDIDGTLLTPESTLSPHTLRVLSQLPSRGIAFAFVTGLNPWVTQRLVDTVGPWTHAVCLSGIFTLEGGQRLAGRFIDAQVAREAVVLALDHGYVPLVYGEDHISRYLLGPPSGVNRDPGMRKIRQLIAERPYQPYISVEKAEALFTVRPAQVAICETPERGAALYPLLEAALSHRAYVVHQPGEPTWVEVAHPEARKDRGLLALARRLGLGPEHVLYFGDSLNDVPVFETFPYTVAVGNARPEIKELAWGMTASNVEDGVARFVAEWFGIG
jgi:hydroxymethylpyrimidine pyrophosphatase-like HAD family hydrolase